MNSSFIKAGMTALGILTFWLTPLLTGAVAGASELNIYSARQEALIKPLLDRFAAQTGITVNLVTGNADALLQRLELEGENSSADILITTDAGRLHRAKQANVLQAFSSSHLDKVVPASFRDPEGYWVGLSLRARPIMYVKGRVDPKELSSYEALNDPKWQEKICIRSSNNIYNQSLVASLIAANGIDATQAWANDFMKNLARRPQGGDRDQIMAAAAGQCDLAIANTYYLAGMSVSRDEAQRAAANKMGVFWPNQQGRGAHVNVSGAAIIKSAKNKDNAIMLLEFLVNKKSQSWYAEANGEYPVRDDVRPSKLLSAWGQFKADSLNLSKLGEYNAEAVRLMDRAGWQ